MNPSAPLSPEDAFVARYVEPGRDPPPDAVPWEPSAQDFQASGWYRVPRASLPPDLDPRLVARIVTHDGAPALAPGLLVVQFAPDLPAPVVQEALGALGVSSVRTLAFAPNLHLVTPVARGFVDVIALAASILERDPRCRSAEPTWRQPWGGRRSIP